MARSYLETYELLSCQGTIVEYYFCNLSVLAFEIFSDGVDAFLIKDWIILSSNLALRRNDTRANIFHNIE